MELRDIQLQIVGPGEGATAQEENVAILDEILGAKDDEVKGKHGKKDKATTVDDLKQEIQMVKLVYACMYLKIKSFLTILIGNSFVLYIACIAD